MARYSEIGVPQQAGFPVKRIVWSVVGLLILFTLYLSAFKTHGGEVDIVLLNGNPVRVTSPGLNFKVPYFETIHTVELRERAYPMTLEAASKDPMELPVQVTLNWAVKKEHVIDMYLQYGDLSMFEERIIKPRLPDAVKGVISTFAVNELLTKRTEVREKSKIVLLEVIPEDIVTITGFAITNIGFPKSYTDQITRVQVQREAANEQAEILRQQNYKAQERTNIARAEADAVKLKADAEAYAIRQNADADAHRIQATGKSELDNLERRGSILTKSTGIIEYQKAEAWGKGAKFPDTFIGSDGAISNMWNMMGKTPLEASKK